MPYPLVGGAKIRAYYLIRQLARQHEVTLVSFTREDDQPDYVRHLAEYCVGVHTIRMERSPLKDLRAVIESYLRGKPIVINRDRLQSMQSLIIQLTTENWFDIVHADQTSMAEYGLFAAAQYSIVKQPLTILDQHNALFKLVSRQAKHEHGIGRLFWSREGRLLAEYERQLCLDYAQIITVTDEDARGLLGLFNSGPREKIAEKVSTIPICVDPAEKPPINRDQAENNVLHLGTMFWPPNVEGVLWFARAVLPLIIRELPDVRFIIAGKNPPKAVMDLVHSDNEVASNIEVTGFIPDAGSVIAQSKVFVVPLLAGGGMRVKILDAWLWGIPLVSTGIGAEGIDINPGKDILIADDPSEFAQHVITVLKDPVFAAQMVKNGRQTVETHYNWRTTYPMIEQVYSRVSNRPGVQLS